MSAAYLQRQPGFLPETSIMGVVRMEGHRGWLDGWIVKAPEDVPWWFLELVSTKRLGELLRFGLSHT